MRSLKIFCIILFLGLTIPFSFQARMTNAQNPSQSIGERPALEEHIDQKDIESGKFEFNDLLEIGMEIFAARWNFLDGQGRPAATGAVAPTKRNPLIDALHLNAQSGVVDGDSQFTRPPNGDHP